MHQHVPFEFSIIKEALAAAFVRALEQFVPVDRVVLFQ
jgi:hypothetical protein